MERYESKDIRVERFIGDVYEKFSRMDTLTPFLADKVEAWEATEDTCSFRAKGFPVTLRIAERIPDKMVKVLPEGQTPFQFEFFVEFAKAEPYVTSMKFVLDIVLNPMMKMMVGGQIRKAMDSIADNLPGKL